MIHILFTLKQYMKNEFKVMCFFSFTMRLLENKHIVISDLKHQIFLKWFVSAVNSHLIFRKFRYDLPPTCLCALGINIWDDLWETLKGNVSKKTKNLPLFQLELVCECLMPIEKEITWLCCMFKLGKCTHWHKLTLHMPTWKLLIKCVLRATDTTR